MGLGGVLVTLASAAGALLVLPAVLAVLGKRLDSLSIRSRALHTTAVERGGWYRLAAFVLRRPVLIALVTATGLILLGLPFLRIQFTSVDASILPTSSSARQVSDRVDRDFVGHLLSPVQIVATAPASEAAQLTSYANNVARVSGIDGVLPPRMIGKATWEIDALLRDDPLSVASPHTVKAVRALPHPFPVLVDGVTARFVDLQSSLAAHIPAALAVVIVATFVVVFAATGSLVLPLKSLLMNLLSISATFGALVLIFQDGRLQGLLQYQSQGALESTQPLLLFAVAFGLSTDYAVFLLLRIKEAHDAGAPTARAVALGLERTGRVVTAAALLFCVAIGAFATSQVVFIKEVGVGTALAVLIDATVVRALLVPALMALLGRWNWWAPRPLRRVHSALGLAHLELAATKTIAETAS
jgi:RND superfamily putative drug exporter